MLATLAMAGALGTHTQLPRWVRYFGTAQIDVDGKRSAALTACTPHVLPAHA